jgi:hypothetical protein
VSETSIQINDLRIGLELSTSIMLKRLDTTVFIHSVIDSKAALQKFVIRVTVEQPA